jgi:hypothetical protein
MYRIKINSKYKITLLGINIIPRMLKNTKFLAKNFNLVKHPNETIPYKINPKTSQEL